jgi:hypothetical protein
MPTARRPPRRALLATLPLVLLLGSGCTGDDPARQVEPSAPTTLLSSIDTTRVTVARAAFCDRLGPESAEEALGGEVDSSSSYGNGEPAQLGDGVRDVAHEFGCSWTAAGGATARAWVFAPPVTRARARRLQDEALGPRCAATKDVGFGAPSVATLCATPEGTEQGHFGLFGDAWLSCTLTLPRRDAGLPDQPERVSAWCAAVLRAAADE